jgi:hypothetical protein
MALYRKPFADAESPRTRQMWLDYDAYSLPSHSDDVEIFSALKGLYLYCKRQQPSWDSDNNDNDCST